MIFDTLTYSLSVAIAELVLLVFLLIYLFLKTRKNDGSLVIDTSDPEKDLYQIKLDTPLDDLPKKKKITLKIELTKETS